MGMSDDSYANSTLDTIKPSFNGIADQIGVGLEAKLFEDASSIGTYGLYAQRQHISDGGGAFPRSKHPQYFKFTRR